MRIFLAVLGGVFLVIVLILTVGGYFLAGAVGDVVDDIETAMAFSDQAIEDYSQDWDHTVLLDRAATELKAGLRQNPTAFDEVERILRDDLGAPTQITPSECPDYNRTADTRGVDLTLIGCRTVAYFDAGHADFSLTLVKRDGSLLLGGLFVNVTANPATLNQQDDPGDDDEGPLLFEPSDGDDGANSVPADPQTRLEVSFEDPSLSLVRGSRPTLGAHAAAVAPYRTSLDADDVN